MTKVSKIQKVARLGQTVERVNRTVRFWRIVLRAALLVIFLLFVKATISQLPWPSLSGLGAYVILKLSFAIYMYCWYYGCNRDLSVQNDVLRDAPKPAMNEVAVAAVVFAAFAFLFYVEQPQYLSIAFISFLALNVGGWVFLCHRLRPFARQALKGYRDRDETVHEVKTLLYQDYLFGQWQWWRFAAGFAVLAALLGVSFDMVTIPGLPKDATFACLIALTILVLESWIWYRRFKLKIQWDGLDWLNEKGFVVASKRNIVAHGDA